MTRGAGASANRARRRAGFTKQEFAVALAVMAVLTGIFLERSLTYQEYGEQAAMESSLRNMRSGLRLKIADLMTQGRMKETGMLLEQNPVHWLPPPPPNYLGELRNPDPRKLAPGNWYFDSERREVVYLPERRRYLTIDNAAEQTLRFRVQATRHQAMNATVGSNQQAEGLALLPVVSYRWSW